MLAALTMIVSLNLNASCIEVQSRIPKHAYTSSAWGSTFRPVLFSCVPEYARPGRPKRKRCKFTLPTRDAIYRARSCPPTAEPWTPEPIVMCAVVPRAPATGGCPTDRFPTERP